MSAWVIALLVLLYVGMIFAVAGWGERLRDDRVLRRHRGLVLRIKRPDPEPRQRRVEEADPAVLRSWALAALDELSQQLRDSGAHADFQQIDILHEGWLLSFTADGVRPLRYQLLAAE